MRGEPSLETEALLGAHLGRIAILAEAILSGAAPRPLGMLLLRDRSHRTWHVMDGDALSAAAANLVDLDMWLGGPHQDVMKSVAVDASDALRLPLADMRTVEVGDGDNAMHVRPLVWPMFAQSCRSLMGMMAHRCVAQRPSAAESAGVVASVFVIVPQVHIDHDQPVVPGTVRQFRRDLTDAVAALAERWEGTDDQLLDAAVTSAARRPR